MPEPVGPRPVRKGVPEGARPLVAVVDAIERDLPDLGEVEVLARVVRVSSADELEAHLDDLEIVFAWNFDRPALLDAVPRAPRLRWIQSISAGVEEFAKPVLAEQGVVLTSAAGVYDPGLAESVLGFLLALSARIAEDARLMPGDWPSDGTRLLRGTTALVVGAGSIGTETGRLLRATGVGVRGIARTPRPPDDVFERIGGPAELHAELADADHVVNVLPRTPQTERLFDAAAFAAMKPTAFFVNIGRGATVDEPALIDALRRGGSAGAADIFERIGSAEDEAFARTRQAEELIDAGRREEAQPPLARALQLYRTMGATAFLRDAERLLAPSA